MPIRNPAAASIGYKRGVRAPFASFSPLSLSPTLWLKGDAGTSTTTDNTALNTWSDQSGNGKHATMFTAASQPTFQAAEINGKGVVRFDGGDHLESAADAAIKPLTIAAVVKATDFATPRTILGATNAGAIHFRLDQTTGRPTLNKGNTAGIGTATSGVVAGATTVVLVTYDASSNYAFFINGTAAGSGTSAQTFTANTVLVGAYGGSQFFLGDIAEVLLIGSAVTAAQRAALTTHLGARWGVTVS